jgi:hypothetical protein
LPIWKTAECIIASGCVKLNIGFSNRLARIEHGCSNILKVGIQSFRFGQQSASAARILADTSRSEP